MAKCDGCIFDNTCVDCNDFDCGELEALLKEHDKQIRAEAEQEHAKICESCIHKVSKEDIDAIRADVIEDYTEWLRKAHANFDEDYAEDIKSDYLEQLKEQDIK